MDEKELRVLIKHCFLMGKEVPQAEDWFDKCYGISAPPQSTIIKLFDEFNGSDNFISIDKKEFRVLIKHCFLMAKNTVQAKEWLDKSYDTAAPAKSSVIKWFAEFKLGRMCTDDAERSGRPNTAVTPEKIEKIHQIILKDSKVKLQEIAGIVKISKERVGHIIRHHLACRYEKGTWGECNVQSMMTRNDKIKPNSDASCEQSRQITKKCKPKGAKPTKGNKGNKAARRNRQ